MNVLAREHYLYIIGGRSKADHSNAAYVSGSSLILIKAGESLRRDTRRRAGFISPLLGWLPIGIDLGHIRGMGVGIQDNPN